MTEATFPLVGALGVILLVLPLSALIAKAILGLLEHIRVSGPLHGLNLRFMLLLASSALPLAWLMSAGIHQAESGRSALTCILRHERTELCLEPGYFALVLAAIISAATVRALRGLSRTSAGAPGGLATRVDHIIRNHANLANLIGRVIVTDDVDFTLGTSGLGHPRVVLGRHFGESLDDATLASALAHESEHVRSYDPLRYLLLEVALAVNPLGRLLLAPHAARWIAAREAHCDREAVQHGASALELADAIVMAARPRIQATPALVAGDVALVRLRVELLLAFAERAPGPCCANGRSAIPFAAALVLAALLLPHRASTRPLDALHAGAEHAISIVWH